MPKKFDPVVKARNAYRGARFRCHNPAYHGSDRYLERGIKFEFQSLSEFIDWIGLPPEDQCTLERIDNNKGYEPGNVMWATWRTQCNNRSSNRHLSIKGKSHTIAQWAATSGHTPQVIISRLDKMKWNPVDAVLKPNFFDRKKVSIYNRLVEAGLVSGNLSATKSRRIPK